MTQLIKGGNRPLQTISMAANYRLRRLGSQPSITSVKDLLELTSDITIIGRNRLVADLFLDSTKTAGLISRIHARIIRTYKEGSEQYELCDTSLNGTYVNDCKVACSVQLKDGDLIAFGHIKGAALDPGVFAPQKNSEFLYKFERIKKEPINDNHSGFGTTFLFGEKPISKIKMANCNHVCTPNSILPRNKPTHQKSKSLTKTGEKFMFDYQTPDVDLQSLVHSINVDNIESSDDEFSLSATKVQTSKGAEIGVHEGSIPLANTVMQSDTVCSTAMGCEVKLAGAKKRKMNLQKENRIKRKSNDGIIYTHEKCASIDCCHPRDLTNTWVQCDDCDQWFHLKCAGLSDKAASSKDTLFHCGCS